MERTEERGGEEAEDLSEQLGLQPCKELGGDLSLSPHAVLRFFHTHGQLYFSPTDFDSSVTGGED